MCIFFETYFSVSKYAVKYPLNKYLLIFTYFFFQWERENNLYIIAFLVIQEQRFSI